MSKYAVIALSLIVGACAQQPTDYTTHRYRYRQPLVLDTYQPGPVSAPRTNITCMMVGNMMSCY